MTDARFLPQDSTGRLFKLIEEMGEVQAALGKAGRHGMESVNRFLPIDQQETNAEWILRELDDLEAAIAAAKPDVVACVAAIRSKRFNPPTAERLNVPRGQAPRMG